MGTYYYLKCEDCNAYTDVIGKNGYVYIGSGPNIELARFLEAHIDHALRFVNEYQRNTEESPFRYYGRETD